MKKILLLVALFFEGTLLFAQNAGSASQPIDGYSNNFLAAGATPVNYPDINPVNIRFFKRIWRDMYLKDEKNQIFSVPGTSLLEVLLAGIREGKITPYDGVNDSFKYPISAGAALARLVDTVLVPVFDAEGNQTGVRKQLNDFNPENIVGFRLKEDVFYDKVRARVETRIIAIAPMIKLNQQWVEGEMPVFWLYFPQCRQVLVKTEVSDTDKGIDGLTLDDLFLQRKFAATIIKESSPTDQRIVDYVHDPEARQK